MNEHIAHHAKPSITWVLIADGKEAQIYVCNKNIKKLPLGGANIHHYYDEQSGHELLTVPEGQLNAESINDYQIGHDQRGTSSSSNSPTHNTYEPQGDIKVELKRRFAQSIAEKLQKAFQEKLFQNLILVAPPKMIGELREYLDDNLQTHVIASLAKELTHYHGQVLVGHLRDTLIKAEAA